MQLNDFLAETVLSDKDPNAIRDFVRGIGYTAEFEDALSAALLFGKEPEHRRRALWAMCAPYDGELPKRILDTMYAALEDEQDALTAWHIMGPLVIYALGGDKWTKKRLIAYGDTDPIRADMLNKCTLAVIMQTALGEMGLDDLPEDGGMMIVGFVRPEDDDALTDTNTASPADFSLN